MSRALVVSTALLVLIVSTGCTRVVSTTIRHPMQTGQLDANRMAMSYRGTERERGLPMSTLDQEAEITRLDTEGMCFDVALRAIVENGTDTWTDLRNFEVALDAGEDLRVVQPELTMREPEIAEYNGLNPERQRTGTRRECKERNDEGQCERWEERDVYETVYVPGIVTVMTGGGVVCFGNNGLVTPQTQKIRLVLRRPARRLHFEWVFQSIVG